MSTPPTQLRVALDGESLLVDVAPDGTVVVRDGAESAGFELRDLGAVGPFPASASGTGAAARVSIAGPGDARTRATVAAVGDELWVWIEGDVFRLEVDPAQRGRPRKRARAEGALTAPMAATVMKILVAPGQEVSRGETLLLLEAMKMEMPVRAPDAGRVTAVLCSAGELVQPGVPLVELAPPA